MGEHHHPALDDKRTAQSSRRSPSTAAGLTRLGIIGICVDCGDPLKTGRTGGRCSRCRRKLRAA